MHALPLEMFYAKTWVSLTLKKEKENHSKLHIGPKKAGKKDIRWNLTGLLVKKMWKNFNADLQWFTVTTSTQATL